MQHGSQTMRSGVAIDEKWWHMVSRLYPKTTQNGRITFATPEEQPPDRAPSHANRVPSRQRRLGRLRTRRLPRRPLARPPTLPLARRADSEPRWAPRDDPGLTFRGRSSPCTAARSARAALPKERLTRRIGPDAPGRAWSATGRSAEQCRHEPGRGEMAWSATTDSGGPTGAHEALAASLRRPDRAQSARSAPSSPGPQRGPN